MATKLGKKVTYFDGLLFHYYHMAYGRKTWQSGDVLKETSVLYSAQPLEVVVTWGHVIN